MRSNKKKTGRAREIQKKTSMSKRENKYINQIIKSVQKEKKQKLSYHPYSSSNGRRRRREQLASFRRSRDSQSDDAGHFRHRNRRFFFPGRCRKSGRVVEAFTADGQILVGTADALHFRLGRDALRKRCIGAAEHTNSMELDYVLAQRNNVEHTSKRLAAEIAVKGRNDDHLA